MPRGNLVFVYSSLFAILFTTITIAAGSPNGSSQAWMSAYSARATPSAPNGFSPSVFKFVTINSDDGKDVAGGWQEAVVTLKFGQVKVFSSKTWTCTLTIGMPLRTVKFGNITPDWAANTSATVATEASVTVMHRRDDWVPAHYCNEFKLEMRAVFAQRYQGLGARVP